MGKLRDIVAPADSLKIRKESEKARVEIYSL
jgi:hypothetical protein